MQAADTLPTAPKFTVWKVATGGISAVQLAASPDIDELLSEQNLDTHFVKAFHFDFEGPWKAESAPLQRLTVFFADPPNAVEVDGVLVPAPANGPMTQLLEAICTDEMCATNPAWLERRKGLSGVCFVAFTDPDDEGVWCNHLPEAPILEKTVRHLVLGVHRAERVRVELLRR